MVYCNRGKKNMRKKFLDSSMKRIRKKYPEYDEEKLEVISYGLEAFYITITKTVVIFGLAFILGVFKETLLIMIFYNIIRTTAFGMHAKESWHCYVISGTLFIGMGLLCKYIDINFYIKLIIYTLSVITIFIYAPADTYKRPLLNAKKRKTYKILTMFSSLIYLILIVVLKDNAISDYLVVGILDASLMIHPLTYRMFQLPYDNYKKYTASYN